MSHAKMHATTFNIAFLVYIALCCILSILSLVFILVDDAHETLYASIVTFILGKLTGLMLSKQAKSMRKQITTLENKLSAPATTE